MLSRDRVIRTIRHQPTDRMPIYGWLRANMTEQISAAFGSVDAFEDRYEFDYAHLFGGPSPFAWEALTPDMEPQDFLDLPLDDPNDSAAYAGVREEISKYQGQKGRFVYVQTPGIFEPINGVFGIENHLAFLLLYEDELRQVYQRQVDWTLSFINNCLDLGVDMIHISDDWGGQQGLMFSPDVWWRMIFPYQQQLCDAVKRRGAFLSLHSDGNINSVLDGIVRLGFDVVHPYQESAGMDLSVFQREYQQHFTVMGGLDIQSTLGFGDLDRLRDEITRVIDMFADGGLLFCTTHFVQDHCTIDELTFAYDLIYERVRAKQHA